MKYSSLLSRAKKLLDKVERKETAPGLSIIYSNHPSRPTKGLVIVLRGKARYLSDGRFLAFSPERGYFSTESYREYAANRPATHDG